MMLKISLLTTRYGFNISWNACNRFHSEKIQLQPKAIFDRATIFLARVPTLHILSSFYVKLFFMQHCHVMCLSSYALSWVVFLCFVWLSYRIQTRFFFFFFCLLSFNISIQVFYLLTHKNNIIMECFKTFSSKIYWTFGQQRLIFYPVNKKTRDI